MTTLRTLLAILLLCGVARGQEVQTQPPSLSPYLSLPAGINETSNISYAGTVLASLGAVTGGSGYTSGTQILSLGSITGGSLYVTGVYSAVPLTGGSGSGATATITVNAAGSVAVVSLASRGTGYSTSDTLSASNTNLGGAGSGFAIPVSAVGIVYSAVPLTGGTGSGATGTITVNSAGAVASVGLGSGGTGYTANDSLSAAAANIGGTGSGFSVLVSTVGSVNSPSNSWLWTQGSISGTAITPGSGTVAPFQIYVTSDTSPTSQTIFSITHASSGGMSGGRTVGSFYDSIVGVPTASGTHVGVYGAVRSNANLLGTAGSYNNSNGQLFGGNFQLIATNNATYNKILTVQENDLECQLGCSVSEANGLTIIHTSGHSTRGTYQDSALNFNDQDAASGVTNPGWQYGILFGAYAHKWAFAADSTLIGAVVRSIGPASSSIALNGVDFSNVSFQSGGCSFKSTGFCVNPTGNPIITGAYPTNSTGQGAVGSSAANGGMYGGQGSTYDATLVTQNGLVGIAIPTSNTLANVYVPNLFVQGNSSGGVTTGDAIVVRNIISNAYGITVYNGSANAAAAARLYLGNSTNAVEASITLNGGSNSSGNGVNSLNINNIGGIWLQGNGNNGVVIGTTGGVTTPNLPTSAGAGGIFVCVDSAGVLYKKATCP